MASVDPAWNRRAVRVLVVGGLTVLAVTVGWLVVSGALAMKRLDDASTLLDRAQTAVADGDLAAARDRADEAAQRTSSARSLTHDPVWTLAEEVPLVGRSARAVAAVTEVTDDVTQQALPPLLDVVRTLDPETLRTGGSIDLARFGEARPAALEASARTHAAAARMEEVRGPFLPLVGGQVAQVSRKLRRLDGATGALERATRVLPPMLGSAGARRYLLAVQNPAEARGTGGILGAYGVLEARAGSVRLAKVGSNADLHDLERLPVDPGPGFVELYGQDPAIWRNSNMSPHFPYAAQIWLALWQRQHRERLDGVVAVDPVLLGYLVRAVGPIRMPDGQLVTGRNTADIAMRDVYERFAGQDKQRDAFLISIGAKVVDEVLAGGGDPGKMVAAVARGVSEQRLLVYSADPQEEAVLAPTRISGSVPEGASPYASVVVNNGGASKLDYYLKRRATYRLEDCRGDLRRTSLELTLTNKAPDHGLDSYVTGHGVRDASGRLEPLGTNRSLVYVTATAGARLQSAERDGKRLALRRYEERGRPVYLFVQDLRPGERVEVRLDFVEPAAPGRPQLAVRPAATKQRNEVKGASCPE